MSYQQSSNHFSGLFADKIFVVPHFQRGYDWEKKNLKELWDDISFTYNDNRYHYMGTLVFTPSRESIHISKHLTTSLNDISSHQSSSPPTPTTTTTTTVSSSSSSSSSLRMKNEFPDLIGQQMVQTTDGRILTKFDVIDGQQRLLSLFLLLLALQHFLPDGNDLKCGIKEKYFLAKEKRTNKYLLKLQLDVDNADFLYNLTMNSLNKEKTIEMRDRNLDESPSIVEKIEKNLKSENQSTTSNNRVENIASTSVNTSTSSDETAMISMMKTVDENGEIVENAEISSHRRIIQALLYFETNFLKIEKEYFSGEVSEVEARQNFENFLFDLHNTITTRLFFNTVIVNRPEDVNIMFEVLNNRGKPLSELEKLKNHLLYNCYRNKMDQKYAKSINDTWSILFKTFNHFELTAMKHEDKLMKIVALVALDIKDGRYDSIKQHFSQNIEKMSDFIHKLELLLSTMKETVHLHCSIEEPIHQIAFSDVIKDEVIRKRVVRLISDLGNMKASSNMIPFICSCHLYLKKYYLDQHDELFVQIIQLLERFSFLVYIFKKRRVVYFKLKLEKFAADIGPGSLGTLSDVIRNISDAIDQNIDGDSIEKKLKDLSPNDDADLIKYLLCQYEFNQNLDVRLDYRKLSIRQIIPDDRSAKNNNNQHQPQGESYTGMIGNFNISGTTKMKLSSLEGKAKEGRVSVLISKSEKNSDSAKNSKKDIIIKRTKEIIQFAISRFSVNNLSVIGMEEEDIASEPSPVNNEDDLESYPSSGDEDEEEEEDEEEDDDEEEEEDEDDDEDEEEDNVTNDKESSEEVSSDSEERDMVQTKRKPTNDLQTQRKKKKKRIHIPT